MKKLILNEWTFVLSVLSFIFVCFLTTGFRNDTYGDIVINFFGLMFLTSFLIFVIVHNLPKKLKYVVFTLIIFGMIVGTLSSCSSVPRYGCTKSKYKTGHKPDGYGY